MNKKLAFFVSFFLPGSIHMYLKQYRLGILGLVCTTLFYSIIGTLFIPVFLKIAVPQTIDGKDVVGIGTYMSNLPIFERDNSFDILTTACLGVFFVLFVLVFNFIFAKAAATLAEQKKNNEYLVSSEDRRKSVASNVTPHVISIPMYILIVCFTLVPVLASIVISFTNYSKNITPPAKIIEYVGFKNIMDLFTDEQIRVGFQTTFSWTLVWTLVATTGVIILGVGMALLLNQKFIPKAVKSLMRTIFIIPWAVPATLSILMFKVFFSLSGTMNAFVIPFFTGEEYAVKDAIPFLMDPELAKMTIIGIQWWLGFPYIFVLITGILQSIPEDLYESANLDGASTWRKFKDITWPLIWMSAMTPFILQYAFQFNNSLLFVLLGKSVVKPLGETYNPVETVASLSYRLLEKQEYNIAAVFGLVSSLFVSIVILTIWIRSGAFKNEEVM